LFSLVVVAVQKSVSSFEHNLFFWLLNFTKYDTVLKNIIYHSLYHSAFSWCYLNNMKMESLEYDELAINFQLFSALRIFSLFDPKSLKIFNHNAYRIAGMMLLAILLCILAYGYSGHIVGSDQMKDVDETTFLVSTFVFLNTFLISFKAILIIYNTDTIWKLIRFTRIDFLSSKECSKYASIMYEGREKSVFVTNLMVVCGLILSVIWISYPLIFNAFMIGSGTSIQRYESIYNPPYPISMSVFNQYYFIFYFMELIVVYILLLVFIIFNTIFTSFSFVFVAQYEILSRAFENIGHDQEFEKGK